MHGDTVRSIGRTIIHNGNAPLIFRVLQDEVVHRVNTFFQNMCFIQYWDDEVNDYRGQGLIGQLTHGVLSCVNGCYQGGAGLRILWSRWLGEAPESIEDCCHESK